MYVYVLQMFAGRFQTNPNNVIEYLVDVSMVAGRKNHCLIVHQKHYNEY